MVCFSRQPAQCKTSTKWCLCDFRTPVIYYSILKNSRNRNRKGQVCWQVCCFHLGAYLRKCLEVRGPWPLRTSRQGPRLPRHDGKGLPPRGVPSENKPEKVAARLGNSRLEGNCKNGKEIERGWMSIDLWDRITDYKKGGPVALDRRQMWDLGWHKDSCIFQK